MSRAHNLGQERNERQSLLPTLCRLCLLSTVPQTLSDQCWENYPSLVCHKDKQRTHYVLELLLLSIQQNWIY
jgi:hypothetical protein